MKKNYVTFFAIVLLLFGLVLPIKAEGSSSSTEMMERSADGSNSLHLFLSQTKKQLKDEYDEIYAGAWLDDNLNPHVSFVSTNKTIEKLAVKYNIILEEAKYSYIELKAIQDSHNSVNRGTIDFISFVDEERNTVVIQTTETPKDNYARRSLSYPLDAIEYQIVEEVGYTEFISLKGGNYLQSPGCSVGFKASLAGSVGFVTAAHCGGLQTPMYVSSTNVGTIAKRQYSGSVDAAWVRLNSGHNAINQSYTGTAYSTVGSTSSHGLYQGSILDVYGKGASTWCKVTNMSVATGIFNDILLSDCNNTKTFPGWSGGLVINARTVGSGYNYNAAGIFLGANQNSGFISKSTNILNALSLTP